MRKSKAIEAVRVAQEITAIRVALHQHGYRLRKRPKQPVWTVYVTDDNFYQMTYQPAPISSWVLYPQNNDASHNTIMNIIQGALTLRPAGIAGRVS
jgi:hypothetical protein